MMKRRQLGAGPELRGPRQPSRTSRPPTRRARTVLVLVVSLLIANYFLWAGPSRPSAAGCRQGPNQQGRQGQAAVTELAPKLAPAASQSRADFARWGLIPLIRLLGSR